MKTFRVSWSQLDFYRKDVEAENEEEAHNKAMEEATSNDIVYRDYQDEACFEVPIITLDVIIDPVTGQREVSLQKENPDDIS